MSNLSDIKNEETGEFFPLFFVNSMQRMKQPREDWSGIFGFLNQRTKKEEVVPVNFHNIYRGDAIVHPEIGKVHFICLGSKTFLAFNSFGSEVQLDVTSEWTHYKG